MVKQSLKYCRAILLFALLGLEQNRSAFEANPSGLA